MITTKYFLSLLLFAGWFFVFVTSWSGNNGSGMSQHPFKSGGSGGFSSQMLPILSPLDDDEYDDGEEEEDDDDDYYHDDYYRGGQRQRRRRLRRQSSFSDNSKLITQCSLLKRTSRRNSNSDALVMDASRSSTPGLWPPWPLSLLKRDNNNQQGESTSSSDPGDDDNNNNNKRYVSAISSSSYPSMGALMLSYLRQRTRIWGRQLEEIGSQVWFNLPPTTPPLLILASIPKRVKVGEDPMTGEMITKLVFPIFSNPFARTIITFGLGMAVLSWSSQELKRKRKLTPIPMSIPYESVSRVFLPPFLPENLPELEVEALEEVLAAADKETKDKRSSTSSSLFGEGEDDDSNNMVSKVSPTIRKHINSIYETATSKPRKNFEYYRNEWKRGRMARKREVARIRRMRIYDELVALQALKRKAGNKKQQQQQQPSNGNEPVSYALVTGASEGIGRAIAVELARWEIPVVLVARNAEKLTALAYDLEACYGVKCCVLQADLSQIDAAEKVYEVTTRAGIPIDILVNNAGVAYEGLAVDMNPADIERMILLNTVTYAKLSQLYGADMKRRRRGRILMVSSMAGLCIASPNTVGYVSNGTCLYVM
jgi:hypothetical protein